MLKTKVQKSPLSIRVPAEDRETLEAAAYKWGLEKDLIESTNDANLSEFLRRIIHDYLEGFCDLHGGRDNVIAEYHRARLSETLAQVSETEEFLRNLEQGSKTGH